jgi:uncharacterized membrane protein YdjX (TVP38/TMEM64 family)
MKAVMSFVASTITFSLFKKTHNSKFYHFQAIFSDFVTVACLRHRIENLDRIVTKHTQDVIVITIFFPLPSFSVREGREMQYRSGLS